MKDKLIAKLKELNVKLNRFVEYLHTAVEFGEDADWEEVFDHKLTKIKRLESEIASLESDLAKEEPEHDTCDGCQMFQDCGCMLDVSICPDCVEHNMWTPREPDELTIQDFKDKYGLVYDDIETAIRNYVNGKQEPMVAKDQYDYPLTTANNHVEIKEQEPEGVTADVETVLFDVMTDNNFIYVSFPAFVENESSVDVFDIACKAMERIASSKQIDKRKFLKDFNSWMCGKQYDGRIPIIDTCIDEYLNNK